MLYTGKALAIKQPWAWPVVRGLKQTENRAYSSNYRGRLFIHASKLPERDFYDAASDIADILIETNASDDGFGEFMDWASVVMATPIKELTTDMGFGAIVGDVELVGCRLPGANDDPWHMSGAVGWQFRNARWYWKPVPYRGQQSLFTVEFEMSEDNVLEVICEEP